MSQILRILVENWWLIELRGAGSIVLGMLVLLYPDLTIFILLNIFTAFSIVNAFLNAVITIRSIRYRSVWPPFMIMAIVHASAALICVVFGDIAAVALFLMIGPWAVVTGILQIFVGFRAWPEKRGPRWMIVGGSISLLFALLLTVQPLMDFWRFERLFGSYAILHGIFFIVDGFELRSLRQGLTD